MTMMSAKFLGADDYRLDPSHNPPYSKSDDEANEKAEVQMHELLLHSSIIGIETGIGTGSRETIVNPDETNDTKLTKRLGEVDYTEAESLL